jgi:hypothetical protein
VVLPDGFWSSFDLLDEYAPAYIRMFAYFTLGFRLSIIMNLIHEVIVAVYLALEHSFFDDHSHGLWLLRQNRIGVPG